MALIQCPECSKWISDHAITCPQCGFPFPEITSLKEDEQNINCPNCGQELSKDTTTCPTCGIRISEKESQNIVTEQSVEKHPIMNNTDDGSAKKKIGKKKKVLITFGLVAVLLINVITGAMVISSVLQKKEFNQYVDDASRVVDAMDIGASNSKDAARIIKDAWEDRMDNSYGWEPVSAPALANLLSSSEYASNYNEIISKDAKVKALMNKLKTPPKGLEDYYESLKQLYLSYQALSNLATHPEGYYGPYSEDLVAANNDYVANHKMVDLKTPEKIK